MSDLRRLFLFFLLLIPGAAVPGQPVIDLRPEDGLHNIVRQCEFFEDTSAAMTIGQVASGSVSGRFRPFDKSMANFDLTGSAIWVRFTCTSAVTDKWYLKAAPEMVTDFRFYSFENGRWKCSMRGYDNAGEDNELNLAMLAFPLDIERGDTAQFYVRIKSTYPVFVLFNAGNANALLKADHASSTVGGIYSGILIIMILYNLFLFISNRDRGYILYTVYIFFCGIFILFTNGYATHFPGFMQTLHAKVGVLYAILFGLFGLWFTSHFLDLKRVRPGWHRLLIFFYIACVIIVPASYFRPLLGSHLIQYLGFLLGIYCIVSGILAWRSGYLPARFYLLGFGFYMISLIIYIALGIAGVIIKDFDVNYILLTGSALEAIILSFAIGDKLNTALRGQQQAQAETLASLQENEKLVREQNIMLEQKVKERTSEISEQKAIIEEKNKDILSSINYARRIQRALLASDQLLTENLPEHFILYKPKDIVSGDFYWAAQTPGGQFMLLCGDCTGHGVPGAFMSLLGVSFLNEITIERKVTRPDEVLNQLRDEVIRALGSGEDTMRDGMDAVFCRFNFNTLQVQFACANNPIWLIRNGELKSFGPDKQPIGTHEGGQAPFSLHEMQLEKGDCLYLFTDGYADQFGGPKGKKFKYKQLQELLLSVHKQSADEQRRRLDETIENWKGGLEQIDDILIIGIRIL